MPITVFVADDHAIVREGLANLLGAPPDIHVVGTAADGCDTVRQVEKLKPEVVNLKSPSACRGSATTSASN